MSEPVSTGEKVPFGRWCLNNPAEVLAMALLALLCVVVFWQVFSRYILEAPVAWGEEFAMFLFQWASFIGAAIATRRSAHYGLDILSKRLRPRARTWAHIFASLLIFFVAYVMIEKGYGMMVITWNQALPVMQFSVAYTYLAILLSGVLMVVYQFPIFWRQIQSFKEK